MKNYIMIMITLLFIGIIITLNGQENKSKIKKESFKAEGVCNQCKSRIENAAVIKGVKKAEWNKETKIIYIIYDTTKTDINLVQKSVALAGHDTEKEKATSEAYQKLPACCKYREVIKTH